MFGRKLDRTLARTSNMTKKISIRTRRQLRRHQNIDNQIKKN